MGFGALGLAVGTRDLITIDLESDKNKTATLHGPVRHLNKELELREDFQGNSKIPLLIPSCNSAPTGGFVPGEVPNRVRESRLIYLLHLGSAGGNSPGCGMGSWLIHGARSGYVCRQMPTVSSNGSQMSKYGGQKLSWVLG